MPRRAMMYDKWTEASTNLLLLGKRGRSYKNRPETLPAPDLPHRVFMLGDEV